MTRFSTTTKAVGEGVGTVKAQEPDDLFLICASYEPRSTAIVKALRGDYRAKLGIIYFNSEFLEGPGGNRTVENLRSIREVLKSHCNSVVEVQGSLLNASHQWCSLRDIVTKIPSGDTSAAFKATVDVTTFSRESLILACALVKQRFPRTQYQFGYASAETHGDWLSRGFRCIRNIIGFSGVQVPALSTLLVVLSGFEPSRTMKIIEEHEPSKVLLGIGDPPIADEFLRRNLIEQQVVLGRQDVEEFHFPANSIQDCRKCITAVLTPYLGRFNLVLAPMSTKLSTIAAWLFAEDHAEVQITYCLPGEYNVENYSAGVRKIMVESVLC